MTSGSGTLGRRLRVAGSALAACAPIVALASCSVSIGGLQHSTNSYTVRSHVTMLVVTNQAGDVHVTGSNSDAVSVTEHISFHGTAPTTTHRAAAGTLSLESRCPAAEICGVDYTITAPRTVTVRVTDSTGTVTLDSLGGPVTVHVKAGKISLSSLAGSVEATSSAGSIEGHRLSSANASLHVSAGQIGVTFTAPATSITATTDVGTITLRVPATVQYNVRATATVGHVRVGISRNPAAARTITASTKTGSITIEPTG